MDFIQPGANFLLISRQVSEGPYLKEVNSFQHPLRDFRGDLVRHPDLDRRPGHIPPAEDQDGAGGGRVEDAQQDGLLQVQLINAK